MKTRLALVVMLAAGLLVPACQTTDSPRAGAAPVQVAAAPYLNAKETQRLKDMLPGPFPRLATASPEEAKAMEKLLSDAEVQVIRGVQDDTTLQARARADRVEAQDPVWDFDLVLGPRFNSYECKAIDHLMSRAAPEVAAIKDAAKKKFGRPRPPGSGLTSNDSYPSGHSTRAFFRARILGEIAPDKKDELIREARTMVVNRIIAGKHHPSDCAGGIVLGSAIAEAMIEAAKDPANPIHDDLEAAKKEWKELSAKKDERGKPGA